MKMIGIYMYENKTNGKKYIGQSVNINRRRREHLINPSSSSKFDNYLAALGEKEFNFSILEECSSDLLDEREQYWIKFYNTIEQGYNLSPGGQTKRGAKNVWARLTEPEVLEIIKLLEEHTLNNKQIASLFGVSQGTIDGINRCLSWTHLHSYKNNIRQENLNLLPFKHSSVSGENNPTSKISESIALSIIEALSSENFKSLAQISRDFQVSVNIITDINRCRTWKYLHSFKENIRDEAKANRLKGADII